MCSYAGTGLVYVLSICGGIVACFKLRSLDFEVEPVASEYVVA